MSWRWHSTTNVPNVHAVPCAPVKTAHFILCAFYPNFLKKLYLLLVCVCVCALFVGAVVHSVEVRGQPCGVSSVFPPLWKFQGSSSGHQACTAIAFTHWAFSPCLFFFKYNFYIWKWWLLLFRKYWVLSDRSRSEKAVCHVIARASYKKQDYGDAGKICGCQKSARGTKYF